MKKALLLFALFARTLHGQLLYSYAGPQTAVPASYFGVDSTHIFQTTPALIPVGTLLTTDMSIGSNNISWAGIETASGTYSWSLLDQVVTMASAANIPDIVYVMLNVPAWNSSNPTDSICGEGNGTCDPNASPAEFVTFMNAITKRYCGKIDYWEGWNEANSAQFWNASIPLLVTYMQAMYTAVHSTANCACLAGSCSPGLSGGTNPNQMITPPLSSPAYFTASELTSTPQNGSVGYNVNLDAWLTPYLSAGGSAAYDIAGLHSYGSAATCYASPEVYLVDVANFKQALKLAGQSNPVIWATELSWGLNTCLSTGTIQNSWISRYLLLHWALGVSRELWYTYDAPGGNSFGLLATSSTQLATYQEMQKWMTGAIEQNCQQFVNNTWSCALTRASGYQAYAVWNSTGTGTYTVPTGIVQYRDVLDNKTATSSGASVSLTASPLLFENQTGAI